MSGENTRSLGQFLEKNNVYTLEGTVFIQSSWNFVKMFIIMKSRPELRMSHVGSKTRSLVQILVKSWVHSRGHSFDPICMEFCQNEFNDKI